MMNKNNPLEALEKLRQNNKDNTHLFDDELLDIIEKPLKALEIIKEKVPLIYLLAGFIGKYNPEEIEIIKEVYIND